MNRDYKRIKKLIFAAAIIAFLGCNNQPKKAAASMEQVAVVDLNFDSVLNCYDYSFQDRYFFTADYGCIYDPNGKNNFGNLSVFLIPYKSIDSTATDSVAEKIGSLNFSEIKKDFNTYVFLIPAADLHYNATGDPEYYQKESFTEKLYSFDTAIKKWYLVDTISIKRDTQAEKEQQWRENFLKSKINR